MNDKTNRMGQSTFGTVQGVQLETTQAASEVQRIGPYEMIRELGRGGMGAVYLARHMNLQRTVAIKLLPREFAGSPERLERFRREMAAIGRLEHPNIVMATDAGETEGIAYIAMQYLDGEDISALVKREHLLAVPDACEIARRAAVGLQHVFEAGLVHRDIKPSNLFLTSQGEIKILDLGLAMLRENDGLSPAITGPHTIMGTPDYIAPEQINASHQVDIRADIYSLGCTLYAILAGQAPFAGQQYSTTTSKLIAHAEKQAVSLKSLRPDVPPTVVDLIEKMMAKSPQNRFAEPRMVADALAQWSRGSNLLTLANPIANTHATASQSLGLDNSGRSKSRFWIAACCAVGALAIALTWMWSNRRPTPNGATENQEIARIDTPATGVTSDTASARPQSDALETPVTVPAAMTPTPAQPTASTAIQASASSIEASLQNISKSAQSIDTSNQKVEENTRKIAQSFDALIKQLNQSKSSQPILDARTPGELYYNALVYEMQGNARLARQAYLAYFATNQDYIDPHLKFIQTVTLQEGRAAVRELYKTLTGDRTLLSRQFAEATLLDEEPRKVALQGLADAHAEFAPVWSALSSFVAPGRGSLQTLHEADQELQYLRRFAAAHERGGLLKYYIDPAEAAQLVSHTEDRLKELVVIERDRMRAPISLDTVVLLGANNWQATIQVAEPVKEIFYRLGENGSFETLGKDLGTDPDTGFPRAKKSFMIATKDDDVTLSFQYLDLKDHMGGPFTLEFRAKEQIVKWEKNLIQQMKPNWVRLQADRLFFDVFQAGRSVLKEVRYGVDVTAPDKVKPIPRDAMSAENYRDYFEPVADSSKFSVVQLLFVDGTQSEVVRVDKR